MWFSSFISLASLFFPALTPADYRPSAAEGIRHDALPEVVSTFLQGCAPYEAGANVSKAGEAALTPAMTTKLLQACAAARALPVQATQGDYLRWLDRYFVFDRADMTDRDALLTAYYEPTFPISAKPTAVLNWPIYALPKGGTSAERKTIEQGHAKGLKALYYTDRWSAFVLQVQGSGTGRLGTGDEVRFVFAGTNNLPYTSIGKVLLDRGEISKEAMSMQSIEAWMHSHTSAEQDAVYWKNPRMVFFALAADNPDRRGPPGAMNLANGLTPYRSAAVDWQHFIPGLPVYLQATLGDGRIVNRLVLAQDRGAAITSHRRMDLFLGSGEQAQEAAGLTQDSHAQLWRLILREEYAHRGR